MSVCVGHTGKLCNDGSTDRDAVWGELTHVGPRIHVLDKSPDPTREGVLSTGSCARPCNVPTHGEGECACPSHAAFLDRAIEGDKTSMRTFAKLLQTLICSFYNFEASEANQLPCLAA